MYEEFLHQVPLFSDLPWEDLTRICKMVTRVEIAAGETLLREGSHADRAFILYSGELEIYKSLDGREALLDRHVKPGTVVGEMALLEETTRQATVRARTDTVLLALGQSQMDELLAMSPTAAEGMLRTLIRRWRATEAAVRHDQQMARLGTLTAGIAHELNNPLAAVTRGAGQLQSAITQAEGSRLALEGCGLTEEQRATVTILKERAQETAQRPPELGALLRSDRERELEDWLADNDVADGWELAPVLVNLGFTRAELQGLETTFSTAQLAAVMPWLAAAHTTASLLAEINQGTSRIAEIVRTLKSYVFLDQAPVQNIDVHAGLDNTLVVLRRKLEAGITVRREYAPDLPRIAAYGSELNQVWTNILDNAIDAVGERGEIVIRTRFEESEVCIEIEDNGPGIPPQHLDKIFDPFFTTKPPGKGTGLGLNLSYSIVTQLHRGELGVRSVPGKTVFEVWLPIHPPVDA